ncbi:MAG: prepilin-type N-terminal cleavage/methylation domain-containing protein [Opitutae bacterium]|nr:prepilin-type N-terminal cleavage/methylation domain-containing protein [Opitutae bacterium]
MTITTPFIEPATVSTRRIHRRAFTLTEVMVAATLTVFVLAGVLSAFLFIGRTGFSAGNYSEIEAELRRTLELFAEDVRQANDIQWNSARSITLTVPTATNATALVTYAFEPDSTDAAYGTFYRQPGPAGASALRQVLVRRATSDFSFHRYKVEQPDVADNTATSDLETKQIQINLRAVRRGATTVAATQSALSARFVLRNKRVSH